MTKILVVEDDLALSTGLCFELDTGGYLTVASYNCQKARQLLRSGAFDLMLLDVNLPDGNGFDLCREIKEELPDLPVIFLTANDLEQDILNGFDLGADDYITKPFNILEVKARIKAIMRRVEPKKGQAEARRDLVSGEMRLDCEGRRAYITGREIGLTAKEFEVLELLMTNPNKVYSREALLKIVWGSDYPGDVRTVDVHIRRLREKIESNPSEPQYVHTKWGVGYYFYNV